MKDTSSGLQEARRYSFVLLFIFQLEEIQRTVHVGLTIDADDVSVGIYSHAFLLVLVFFLDFSVVVLRTRGFLDFVDFVDFRCRFFALRPRNVLSVVPLYNIMLQVS